MGNIRQILLPVALLVGLALAGLVSSCSSAHTPGPITTAKPAVEKAVDGFSLRVWDESFLGEKRAGNFKLETSADGTSQIVEVQARGLQGLKALFISISYNPSEYHLEDVLFTGVMGNPADLLQLHKLHHPGELQIGQVLIQPSSNAGISGEAVFLRVTFEPGPADPIAVAKQGAANQKGGAAVVWQRGVEPNLRWAFGGIADYDQNGEVNVADLTPIALNYSNSGLFGPLSLGHVVDGDGNGEINLADITPIVLHYGEVTTGYDVYLRRIGESVPASHQVSFAEDPLVSFTLDEGLIENGVVQFNDNLMAYSGDIYDGELVSIDATGGMFSVLLGGGHALVEVVPQTVPPGVGPSVFIGGDPAGMPHIEWETVIPGNGTFADPYQVQGSTGNSFRLLDLSAQDVSASYVNSGVASPVPSPLSDSFIFAKVKETSGDWPWTLKVVDITNLSQSMPTRMLAQFAPLTPGDSTAFNAWIAYDPVNSSPDYPLADFSITPNPAPVNWPIRLDASASTIPGSVVAGFGWDIEELGAGDIMGGSEINSDNALSVLWLSNEGDHHIALSISDGPIPVGGSGQAGIERACQIIEAPFGATPPDAIASATPELVEPGEQGVLVGTGSSHPLAAQGYKVVDYYWELTGPGSSGTAIVDDPYSSVSSVAFSGDALGTFTFTLRVLDNVGSTASATAQINVEIIALLPVPAFSASPNPVVIDNEVSFDASASFHNDPLLSIVEYRWDFDGDGTDDLTSGSPDALHTYTETGSFQVRLTVADDADPVQVVETSRALQVDPVPNDPPVPQLVVTSSPTRIGREVTLDASGSTDSDGTIVRYEFDVDGDNNFEYDGIESIRVHTFIATHDLWATVRVTDDDGAVRMASAAMKVMPEASWHTVEIDDGDGTNDVGKYAHLAIVDGFPAIAYYDASAQDLKYVRAKNSRGAGEWRNSIVVAVTPGVDDGHYPVLFQVGSNNPVIAFHDATNGELKIVPALDTKGLAWGSAVDIDGTLYNAGQGLAGMVNANRAALSYFDTTNNKLRFIRATDEAGTTWGSAVEVAQAVNPIGVDSETDVSFNFDSVPCITAQLDGDATFHLATATDGLTWNPLVTIQQSTGPSALTGFLPPIAYGLYYNNVPGELMFEIATQADGSAWNETPSTIGSLVDAGELAMLGPGQTQGLLYDSYIKYFVCAGSPTAGLVAYVTEDGQGATWSAADVIDGGAGAGASGLSMLVADERPAIAWWDMATGHLVYAYYD